MKDRSKANRGKKLEKLIDDTNEYYKLLGEATVEKIPTPFKVIGMAGPYSKGFFERGYLVDYIGNVKGHAITFDAKETNEVSFPLKNLHETQFDFMEQWHYNGATVFLVVHFKRYDKYYRLKFETLEKYWYEALNGGRKSIPYKEFENEQEIFKIGELLHYLGGENNDKFRNEIRTGKVVRGK